MNKTGLIAALILATAICTGAAAKGTDVSVFVSGRFTKLKPPPIIRKGKTYVSMCAIATALGACAKWDDNTKTATITAGNKRARVPQSNGITIDNVLYLPLRTTGEAIGCTIEWDSVFRVIRIIPEAPAPTGGG